MKSLLIAILGILTILLVGDSISHMKQHTSVNEVPSGSYKIYTGQRETPNFVPEHRIRRDNGTKKEGFTSQELLDMIERAEQKGMEHSPEMDYLKEELK